MDNTIILKLNPNEVKTVRTALLAKSTRLDKERRKKAEELRQAGLSDESNQWTAYYADVNALITKLDTIAIGDETRAFEGYEGTWSKIDTAIFKGKIYKLWESDEYGEDCGGIITEDGAFLMDCNYSGLAVDLGDYLEEDYDEIEKCIL